MGQLSANQWAHNVWWNKVVARSSVYNVRPLTLTSPWTRRAPWSEFHIYNNWAPLFHLLCGVVEWISSKLSSTSDIPTSASLKFISFHYLLHRVPSTPIIMYKDEVRVKSGPCRELHQKIWNFFALPLVLNKVSIYVCVVLKKVDTIIRIFFSLCYFLSFVESVDKLKTHAAYLAEGVW